MPQLRTALAVLLCLSVAACDSVVPQQVEGRAPVSSQELRWYETLDCTGPYLSARASATGEFSFSATSWQGGVGVIAEERSLCIANGSIWSPLWASRHGGGAPRLVLRCERLPEQPYSWLAEQQPCEVTFPPAEA